MTPVRAYLQHRGLRPDLLDDMEDIRFHTACPFTTEEGATVKVPAMLALMRDALTNEPRAIHRTALATDGSGKVKLTGFGPTKRMLGPSRGAVVKLSPDSDVTTGLGICEGIETGLAILGTGWAPVWACGSAGGMASFPVLAGVETLTIYADNDRSGTGLAAAQSFRKRLVAYRQYHGVEAPVPFYMVADAPNLGAAAGDAPALIEAVRSQTEEPIRLVVVDTLARTMQGADENSAADMSVFVANCGRIGTDLGCAVAVIHHAGIQLDHCGHVRRHFFVRMPAGMMARDAYEEPKVWRTIQSGGKALRLHDQLYIVDHDESGAFEAVVVEVSDQHAVIHPSRMVSFPAKPALWSDEKYRIVFEDGGYAIKRKVDGQRIGQPWPSEAHAIREMRNLYPRKA